MITQSDLELLNAYIDNALDDAQRAALEARLQAEPALRLELEALRATSQLIRAMPMIRAPRSFALSEASARRIRTSLQRTRAVSLLSAAASFLLIMLGIVLLTPAMQPLASVANAPTDMLATMAFTATTTMVTTEVDERGDETAQLSDMFLEAAPPETLSPLTREPTAPAFGSGDAATSIESPTGGLSAPQDSPAPPAVQMYDSGADAAQSVASEEQAAQGGESTELGFAAGAVAFPTPTLSKTTAALMTDIVRQAAEDLSQTASAMRAAEPDSSLTPPTQQSSATMLVIPTVRMASTAAASATPMPTMTMNQPIAVTQLPEAATPIPPPGQGRTTNAQRTQAAESALGWLLIGVGTSLGVFALGFTLWVRRR